jgi:ABC-type transport system involved in cytochrome bd biosynthesis fused ATPase/permease subunit
MNLDPSKLVNLLNANVFVDLYNKFLNLFPPSTHWLVSLIILVAIAAAIFSLITANWLFLLLAILLFPVIYPVLKNFFGEIYTFVVYLWNIVSTGLPKT